MRPEAPPPGVLYDIVAVSMTVSETSTWRDQAGEGKSVESLRSDTAAERYRALLALLLNSQHISHLLLDTFLPRDQRFPRILHGGKDGRRQLTNSR